MKVPSPLCIRGQGVRLPGGRISVARLVAAGEVSPESARAAGYEFLSFARSPAEASSMALAACRGALRSAGLAGRDIGLIVFSTALLRARSYWSAAGDLCRRLGASRAEFVDLYQGCNGVMSSVDYAAAKFASDARLRHVLVAASEYLPERFAPKWRWDFGAFYGDGAGAWVLSREGPLAIRARASRFLPELDDFIWTSFGSYAEFDARGRGVTPREAKRRFLRRHGAAWIHRRILSASRGAIAELLRDTGLGRDRIDAWILQNFGRDLVDMMRRRLAIPADRCPEELGTRTGHVGNVDPILNLYRATRGGGAVLGRRNPRRDRRAGVRVQDAPPGTRFLLLSHGAGFTVMGLLLERVESR